jgi:hypothetical protein
VADNADSLLGFCEADVRFQCFFPTISLPGDHQEAAMLREEWERLALLDVIDILAGPIA